ASTAHLHGGVARASSVPGQSTRFEVDIPAAPANWRGTGFGPRSVPRLHVLDARRERVAPRGFNGRGAIAVELPDGVDQCVDEGSVERGIDVEVAAAVEIGRASCRERVSMWVVVVCALRKSRINVKLRW